MDGATEYTPTDPGDDADVKIDVPVAGLLDDAKRRYAEFLGQVTGDGFVKPRPITMHQSTDYKYEQHDVSLLAFRLAAADKSFVTHDQLPELAKAVRDLCGGSLGDALVVPMPTIGGRHADGMIRRVGLLAPPPMRADVLRSLVDSRFVEFETGARFQLVAVPDNDGVTISYSRKSRVWRSVTPLEASGCGGKDKRGAADMVIKEMKTRGMMHQLLSIRLDKVPDWGGLRRLPDAAPLWYAEVEFKRALQGPVVVGTGSDCGNGVLAPAQLPDVAYYVVLGRRPHVTETVKIAAMMRDAVMSKAGRIRRDGWMSPYLSGHDENGKPLRDNHAQAYWLPVDNDRDGLIDHIAVYARHGIEPSVRSAFSTLTKIYDRKGNSAHIRFAGFYLRNDLAGRCTVFGKGKRWVTATPYFAPWHKKRNYKEADQVKKEARLQKRKVVHVDTGMLYAMPTAGGAVAIDSFESKRNGKAPFNAGCHVTIRLSSSEPGPILLGSNSHFGLGMFVPSGA